MLGERPHLLVRRIADADRPERRIGAAGREQRHVVAAGPQPRREKMGVELEPAGERLGDGVFQMRDDGDLHRMITSRRTCLIVVQNTVKPPANARQP